MKRLCINSRDELKLIALKDICYMKACGNYTDFYFVDGKTKSETGCLSLFTKQIEELYPDGDCPFIRVGRSHAVNIEHIILINIPQRTLQTKMPSASNIILPKRLLKELRDIILSKYKKAT
ncbi:MAG: LytTR family transcriptional regulator [Bacteroidaceae bacterium]|nr:LytTR family transcriptional regulator [Bacteroidaceae bacterium]